MVEHGFELSEASNTPVIMDLRIRACHVHGSFVAERQSRPGRVDAPPARRRRRRSSIYDRLAHPPATFRQEKLKIDVRLPAARKYIAEHKLNEIFAGSRDRRRHRRARAASTTTCCARCRLLGLADDFGAQPHPDPRAERRLSARAGGDHRLLRRTRRRCWWSRKASPSSSSRTSPRTCAAPTCRPSCTARTCCMMAGEYTTEVMVHGLARFLAAHAPQLDLSAGPRWLEGDRSTRAQARPSCSARRCRRARRRSASAARSARCSRR